MSLILCLRLGLALVLLLVVVGGAQAQYEPNFELSLQGGYDGNLTSLGDVADDGFATGASLGYRLADRLVVGGDFRYHNFNVNSAFTAGFPSTIDVTMTMLEFGGFVKAYTNSGDHRFYLRGTAGVFRGRTEVDYRGQQQLSTTTDPGISGAVGFEIVGHRNSATFFEASYRRVLGDDLQWLSVSLGASFFIW